MGKSFCLAGTSAFPRTLLLQKQREEEEPGITYESAWKRCLMSVYMPMQMSPVSDYRCISGITNLTFFIALHPLTAAPGQCALTSSAAAVEGAGLCQHLLMGITAWS